MVTFLICRSNAVHQAKEGPPLRPASDRGPSVRRTVSVLVAPRILGARPRDSHAAIHVTACICRVINDVARVVNSEHVFATHPLLLLSLSIAASAELRVFFFGLRNVSNRRTVT
jgi:hypothetical protein